MRWKNSEVKQPRHCTAYGGTLPQGSLSISTCLEASRWREFHLQRLLQGRRGSLESFKVVRLRQPGEGRGDRLGGEGEVCAWRWRWRRERMGSEDRGICRVDDVMMKCACLTASHSLQHPYYERQSRTRRDERPGERCSSRQSVSPTVLLCCRHNYCAHSKMEVSTSVPP